MATSSPASRRQYLQDYKEPIESALSSVMAELIKAEPADPIQYLATQLLQARNLATHRKRQKLSQDAKCMLDHNTKLDIYSAPADRRSTGIVCTIGPKTESVEKLSLLRTKGLNIMRMNFSHGSHEEHAARIANLRKSVTDDPMDGRLVGIALDTKGPEIRTGTLKTQGDPTLTMGSTVKVTVDPAFKKECSGELIYMDYTNLPKVMSVGGLIYVDDGLLSLKVREIPDEQTLICEVMNTAALGSHKGCNLPEVDVDLPALSEKDKGDLAFGVQQNVDMVFASFIRKAADVRAVRECLLAADPEIGKRIRIISKIENHEGMRNFDEILAETDGVMVARGDLGIEIPSEKVFLAQKMMIAKCNVVGKPVICATQMLESMTFNPRPTRAEVSDVANAVLDGADCVMLSGETAKGKYPSEAVAMMAQTCREAEAALFQRQLMQDMVLSLQMPLDLNDSVAKAVVDAATTSEAALIITLTHTGNSGRLISKFRPNCPILVLTRNAHNGAVCNLYRGCIPFRYPHPRPPRGGADDREERFAFAIKRALECGLVVPGSTVVLTHGVRSTMSLTTFRVTKVLEDGTVTRELPSAAPGTYDANIPGGEKEVDVVYSEPVLMPFVKMRETSMGQQLAQEAKSWLDHNTKLDIYSRPTHRRKTGIVCTIGPKTESVEKLTLLRTKGLNVMRMNFSHGSHEEHAARIANLRKSVAEDPMDGRLVGIALDTKGPEIRTGTLKTQGDPILTMGSTVKVTVDPAFKKECSAELIYMDYTNLPKVMSVGGLIYVDDGLLSLKVREIPDEQTLICEVMNTAALGSHKGCNLPEVDVDLPALSEKDKGDLAFGVQQGVDMVFASFIRKAADVREVRACLLANDPVKGKKIRIISKIENHEGMRNFDEILAETDGVMVARGDLGIEIPSEKVFLAQKMMIAKCNVVGKPVICATQMLESMTFNPRPTRAEVSDVANAVLDGADCVMLSGETAKGKYPAEAVAMMEQTCNEAEAALFQRQLMQDMALSTAVPLDPSDCVAKAIVDASMSSQAVLIITLTTSGTSARLIAKWRPRCPLVVVTRDTNVGGACNLHRGCIPFFYPHPKQDALLDSEERFAFAVQKAKELQLVKPGDQIVLAQGSQSGVASLTTFRMTVVAE